MPRARTPKQTPRAERPLCRCGRHRIADGSALCSRCRQRDDRSSAALAGGNHGGPRPEGYADGPRHLARIELYMARAEKLLPLFGEED